MDEENHQKQRDVDDYNREVAGISGARITRFLQTNTDEPVNKAEAEKKASDELYQRMLDILMQDPLFAAAYKNAEQAINDTQAILTKAMTTTADNIERLTNLLADMEARTAKLADGTAVFRASDGSLVTADGSHLSKADTALLQNPESLLDYDRYSDARDALQSARARQTKFSDIQTDIDQARHDIKNAKSVEDLEAIESDMHKIQAEVQSIDSAHIKFNQSAAQEVSTEKMELNFSAVTP